MEKPSEWSDDELFVQGRAYEHKRIIEIIKASRITPPNIGSYAALWNDVIDGIIEAIENSSKE